MTKFKPKSARLLKAERDLIAKLHEHGYRFIEVQSERERVMCQFKRVKGRLEYSDVRMLRVAVPMNSHLAVAADEQLRAKKKRKR